MSSDLSVSGFVHRLGCHRQNVYDIFRREVIDVGLLLRISIVLEHDLVTEFYGAKGTKVTLKFHVTVEITEDGQYKVTEVQTVK